MVTWERCRGEIVAKTASTQLEIVTFTLPGGKVKLLFQSWGKGGEYRSYSLRPSNGKHEERLGAARCWLDASNGGFNPREYSALHGRRVVNEIMGGKRPHPPIS